MALQNTDRQTIDAIHASQKEFFKSGATLDISFRKQQLKKFIAAMQKWEKPLTDALWTDLHKSYEEAYMTETSLVVAEAKSHLKHVASWAKRECRRSPLAVLPATSHIVKEPLGNTLIVSPWNYPVQLLLNPLVGAISSGCTAILKPSPYVPNVSLTIQKMIEETFDSKYIAVVQGNREVNTYLLEKRYDLIFFTGSPALAKTVMAAAAKNLTPCVLELGGKSPCIVDKSANIKIAAKRLAWGKTVNAGQTCIAPDYLLINKEVKDQFVAEFIKAVKDLHGEDSKTSKHYVRMVSDKAFDRVSGYLNDGKVIFGGEIDKSERYISPTLLDEVSPTSSVMTDEIFGPVFPIITFENEGFLESVQKFVTEREKPLAFYYYGSAKDAWKIIGRTTSGGGCINDSIMHIVNDKLPFGGVGNSGMGHYHNRESFEAFSHRRSILKSAKNIDMPFRYMPYKFFSLVKKLI
ncbi:MAG: aldehyde dehydrogenase family protein [Bacteroidales bacterium]|nr:aldehyde dehydrogenase family protein [Bacteroidales bacterium]